MKLIYESHGYRYSVEHNSDDFDSGELKEIFSKILVQAGFSPRVVEFAENDGGRYEYVGEDEIVVKREEIEK